MFLQDPDDLQRMMQELGITAEDVMKAAGSRALDELLNSATLQVAEQQDSELSDALDLADNINQAKARFKAEKDLFPTPFVTQPRMPLLRSLEAKRQEFLRGERGSYEQTKQTVIGIEIHVSKIPLEKLDRVSLRQMHVRKTHKGKYLLCRIISLPIRIFSAQMVVEDVNGDVCMMTVYNYPGTVGARSQLLDALFPVGSILAIREPTLKFAANGGNQLLRVDCPSDIIWLEPDDERLVGAKWKTGGHVSYSPRLPSTEEEWKKQGNGHYQKGLYIPAAVAYSRGLQRFPASSVLRLNRAMAYLQLEYYGAALSDCETAQEDKDLLESLKSKALFRAARALYGLGRWDEAERSFANVAAGYPSEAAACDSWIQKCKDRRKEATEGKYDWVAAFKAAQEEGYRMDLADFTGPVEVASLSSRGGGRGIVAKRDIKFGELLVVSKAFAFWSMDFANPEIYMATNLITNTMEMGCSAVNATRVAERIAGNPRAADAINQLYAGPANGAPSQFNPAPSEKVNVARLLSFDVDVDIGRIEAVLSFNSFSCLSLKPRRSMTKDYIGRQHGGAAGGLFLLPSLFNHSCAPNAYWYCLGDVLIVRATCDIRARKEIFLSYGAAGDSYTSRAKSSCLARLLGSCNCSLCAHDRQVGKTVCEQRDQISSKISSCTTTSAIQSQIKKLEKTYEGYANADRYAVYRAYRALWDLYKTNSDPVNALQVSIKSLKYVGLEVTDTSLQGDLAPSVRNALPIKLVATEGSRTGRELGYTAVDDCVAIHNIFSGEFDDMPRAAKWLKGAVWLHDKCYGGGKDLFWERYPHLSHHRDLL